MAIRETFEKEKQEYDVAKERHKVVAGLLVRIVERMTHLAN